MISTIFFIRYLDLSRNPRNKNIAKLIFKLEDIQHIILQQQCINEFQNTFIEIPEYKVKEPCYDN